MAGTCDLLPATRDSITARHRWQLVGLGLALFALALLVPQVQAAAVLPLAVAWGAGLLLVVGGVMLFRVLGPLERLFIILLGHSGQLGAAAVVVAAKGLLRYPELQRSEREEGPTDLSEYFLIGSFTSWLVAIAGLLLIRLA